MAGINLSQILKRSRDMYSSKWGGMSKVIGLLHDYCSVAEAARMLR